MSVDSSQLESLNELAINLTQAMLGLISSNFRRVAISRAGGRWRLTFILAEDDPADRDEIEDIAFQLDATYGGGLEFDVEVEVTHRELWAPHPEQGDLVVYWRKEDE